MKFFKLTKISREFIYILLLIALSLPVILPYFHPGFFPTHDGEWAVVRLTDMFRTLRDHQFPPRYSGFLNFEYGYPLFNFTYPFPYYLGVVLHFFKIGFVDSIKLIFAASVPLSAIFMFLLSKKLWKSTLAGFIGAVFYVYLPYRLVDLFVRGSIGESISFALYPLLVFLFARLCKNPSWFSQALFSIFLAVLVMSHNIMAVFFLPVIFVFFVFFYFSKEIKSLFSIITSVFLGGVLSAFFWAPALLEKHNILLSKIPIANRNLYFVTLKDLFIPKWGYGVPTAPNGFSYQIGWPLVLIFLLVVGYLLSKIFFVRKRNYVNREFKLVIFIVIGIIALVFMLFPVSAPIWKTLPLLSDINYPWTLLLPLGFLLSLLSGFLADRFKYVSIVIVILAVIAFLPHAKPSAYINRGDAYYLTNEATTTSSSELMPLWVKVFPTYSPLNKVAILNGKGKVENIYYNSKLLSFSTDSSERLKVEINIIYYPGWSAYINGLKTVITYSNPKGVMNITIPAGKHTVLFKLTETPLRLTSDIISVVALCFILLIFIREGVVNIRK